MKVRKLTEAQKDLLVGQTYDGVQFFNPTQDANGNWFISNEEVSFCTKEEYNWVSELEEIDHNPIVNELPNQ